jgi:hypothetical protein
VYCKKCRENYSKNKKVCSNCGIALLPGTLPDPKRKGNLSLTIIGCSVLVVIIAFFLIIGLGNMVPYQLKGTWYDAGGDMGVVVFKSQNTVEWTVNGVLEEDRYTFGEGKGVLTSNGSEYNFTCDGTTLQLDDAAFTKQYVEQKGLSGATLTP